MSSSPFSETELERYARHIIMREIGGGGQQKLKNARVLVVGAGGLGSPILQYLAAAGVGIIGIVDDDDVSLSNLQRQIIHDTDKVGQPKVESAAHAIERQNPHIMVETHRLRLNHDNAGSIIENYDIVVDGSDNSETRYMLAEICEAVKRPLVSGAIGRFDGSVTVLIPYEKDNEGRDNPRYRDLFPVAPAAGSVPACAEAGVLGVLPGIVGSLQAMEAIKLIVGIGEPLIGRLLLYDALACRFETIRYKRKA